ncbi:MAG: toprim domain-containing protein, partial [Kosmotogaceae bacterium]|nr:toprim domain-containing protein [Kosmotogaceae bacterium]
GLMNRESAAVYRDGIILTESVIDALSLLHTGIENVVPCYGVNGFTEEHSKLLKDNRVEEIIIAFDADEAGRNAAEKLSHLLIDDGFHVRSISPEGLTPATSDRGIVKDWNDVLLAGISKDEIKQLIDEAPVQLNEQSEKLFTVEKDGPRYQFLFADLIYRILGAKETFVSSLRVNVRVERTEDSKKFLDNVDLYSARSRGAFALSASVHFSLETSRIERDLLLIVDHLEEERDKALSLDPEQDYVLTPQEEAAGMELLQSPDLIGRIVADTETLGYVGEDTNKLLLYIAASTRKLADPLSVIVISESAAGKSYLIDTVKKLMPPEDVVSMTSLSDQALNYLPENGLLHKFLVMGEAVHGDVVEHQVREMLSAHELSRLVTMKDPKTGELSSRTVRKDVIVSVAMSSTDYEINPENASRCFVINTDESEEQTIAIHHIQRKKYSLERYEEREEDIPGIIMQHQAAQRLLKPRIIVNPLT